MTLKHYARTTATGIGAIAFLLACLSAVLVVFAGIPAYFYGEAGAVFGAGLFALLSWGYILGLYNNL